MNQTKPSDSHLDDTVADRSPPSDPPADTPVVGSREAERDAAPDDDMEPKGLPTSDRHASETTAGRVEGTQPAQHKH